MKSSFSGNWNAVGGRSSIVVAEQPISLDQVVFAYPCPVDTVKDYYATETLNFTTKMQPTGEGPEPFSLQWFLDIEQRRHTRHGSWIPHLLEFSKHSGETLLGLGDCLGTDWVQYARHGGNVIACCPSASRLSIVRRNFELRGLGGRFLHAVPDSLPLESASIDVVCVSSWLDEVGDPARGVQEIYRVLKPGGKVLALVPAKYDVAFWADWLLPWTRLLPWKYPGFEGTPLSARRLKRRFGCFIEHRIHKRQLRRREIPYLWRWAPLGVLQRLMGRMLILKAFKPLSAAVGISLAA